MGNFDDGLRGIGDVPKVENPTFDILLVIIDTMLYLYLPSFLNIHDTYIDGTLHAMRNRNRRFGSSSVISQAPMVGRFFSF